MANKVVFDDQDVRARGRRKERRKKACSNEGKSNLRTLFLPSPSRFFFSPQWVVPLTRQMQWSSCLCRISFSSCRQIWKILSFFILFFPFFFFFALSSRTKSISKRSSGVHFPSRGTTENELQFQNSRHSTLTSKTGMEQARKAIDSLWFSSPKRNLARRPNARSMTTISSIY